MSNYPVPAPAQNYPPNSPPYVNYPQGDTVPLYVNSPEVNNYPTAFPVAQHQTMGDYPYPNQSGNMPQTSYPGMPQPTSYPGMPQPGMPQPGVPQPSVCPTAPNIGAIPGYEGLTCDNAVLPPPTVPAWEPDPSERKALPNLPVLTEEEIRDAVIQYSSEHCCYASKVGRDMDLKEIFMMSAFHYMLETFTEKRESAWRFEPFTGQYIDGPSNGPAPNPWDVTVMPIEYFKDAESKVEVPHTAQVKTCHTCVGNGRVRCENCKGNGRKVCTWCKGKGRREHFEKSEVCTSCNGTGWDRCIRCDGTGQDACRTCDKRGTLKLYVELTVTWTNHVDNYISETSTMPKELVLKVTGQVAYEEENPRVYPLTHIPEQTVRNATQELVTKHSKAFVNERILKQRQCLRVVPIGQVRYDLKEKVDEFFVYGFEHKVYFKKYPQKCACTIM